MKRLYIDVDGVLIPSDIEADLPEHILPFIDFVTENFDCYWLTSYCRGNTRSLLKVLAGYFAPVTMEKLLKVKPTDFKKTKAEGIDLSSDFIWIDDSPTVVSKNMLSEVGRLDRLIVVDLETKDELIRVMELLATKLS
jgi:hypothetical protein